MTLSSQPPIDQLAKKLRAMPSLLGDEMRGALGRTGREWQRRMSERMRQNAYRGFGKRAGTGNRSGQLRRSLFSEARPAGTGPVAPGKLELAVGSRMLARHNYARIQEKGGVVRATRSRFLTIPLPPALHPTGVLKAPARMWPKAFFIRDKRGRLFLANPIAKGAKGRVRKSVELLFMLVKSVRLQPKLGMTETMLRTHFGEYGRAQMRAAIRVGLNRTAKAGAQLQ